MCKTQNRKYFETKKQIGNTYIYLPFNEEQLRVCNQCFLKTFDVSNRFATNVLKNKAESSSGVSRDDKRGLYFSANKNPDSDLQLVKEYSNSIPFYESLRQKKRQKIKDTFHTFRHWLLFTRNMLIGFQRKKGL